MTAETSLARLIFFKVAGVPVQKWFELLCCFRDPTLHRKPNSQYDRRESVGRSGWQMLSAGNSDSIARPNLSLLQISHPDPDRAPVPADSRLLMQ